MRRGLRITLRSFFLVFTLLCVYLGSQVNRARDQRHVVGLVNELGGKVYYDDQVKYIAIDRDKLILNMEVGSVWILGVPGKYSRINNGTPWGIVDVTGDIWGELVFVSATSVGTTAFTFWDDRQKRHDILVSVRSGEPSQISWLHNLLGADHFRTVTGLDLSETDVSRAQLSQLSRLPHLFMLVLGNTHFSNADVVTLKGLSNLRWLDLCSTDVTDEGLKQLKPLGRLGHLYLENTKVSAAGVHELQELLPHCVIRFGDFGVEPNEFQ